MLGARKEHNFLQCYKHASVLHVWTTFRLVSETNYFVESRQGLVQGQQTAACKDVYITASQGTSWQAHVAVESGFHTAMATDFMAIHNVTSFRLIGTNESGIPAAYILTLTITVTTNIRYIYI